MNKIWKYGVLPVGIVFLLLLVTLALMPVLIDVQRFVPEIEKRLGKTLNRPVTIGRDVAVSFFPSPSLTFSDLKIGNPPGFTSEALVKIDSFEGRISLLPLLKKEIRISRFVVGGLEINLEKNADGKENWRAPRLPLPRVNFLQDHVTCALLAVADGRVNWIDKAHIRHRAEKLMLLLNTAQPGQVALDFKAAYDDKPMSLEGKIGPFRQDQGERSLPLDLGFHFMETLQGQVQGKIDNWETAPVYDLAVNLSSFSPRKLFAALGLAFPVETADPTTFQVAGLDLAIKARRDNLTVEKATARLDDTAMVFSCDLKSKPKPEVNFSLAIDRLDLDRYRLGGDRQEPASAGAEQGGTASYLAHLARNSAWAGTLNIQTLKMYGVTGSTLQSAVGARGGIISLDHAAMQLYGGRLTANLAADLTGDVPRLTVAMQGQGLEAATMLRQLAGRELMTGTLTGDMSLTFSGESSPERQASLAGQASFACLDGALLGVDLSRVAAPRQTAKAGPAGEGNGVRTDFAELKAAMAIEAGQVTIRQATLASPAMALTIGGGVDIPGRAWQLQVAPQGTELKPGKGEGNVIRPLTIAGTFQSDGEQPDRQRQAMAAAGTARGDLGQKGDGPLAGGRVRISDLRQETTL